jgi:hypothetical protein
MIAWECCRQEYIQLEDIGNLGKEWEHDVRIPIRKSLISENNI